MSQNLIVFFSMTGETYADGGVINLDKGYTHIAAEYIKEAVGGKMFRVEQTREYSTDHFTMIKEAKEELDSDEDPEIKEFIDSIDGYDVIYIGFPNWYNTMPGPLMTFLKHYDWNGKKIAPFVTSGGGSSGHAMTDLGKLCAGAEIMSELSVVGTEVEHLKNRIMDWAKEKQ